MRRTRAIAATSFTLKAEAPAEYKKVIKADGKLKNAPLDSRVPDKAMCIGIEIGLEEHAELLAFLDKNSDVFAWSTSDLVGVSRDITITLRWSG
jgi:hypothetical protein